LARLFLNVCSKLKNFRYLNSQWGENEVPFVWSNSRIHLDTESSIYLSCPFIINPSYTKHNDSIRFNHSFQSIFVLVFLFSSIKGITVSATSKLPGIQVRLGFFSNLFHKSSILWHDYRLLTFKKTFSIVRKYTFYKIFLINIYYIFELSFMYHS
jgi:hypothetical protein